jgi:hypothetical protein
VTERPARTFWVAVAVEGLRALTIVAAVGVGASLAVWLLADPAYGLGVALRIGALYLGAFHHVPIRIEGEFDIGELTGGVLPSSDAPTEGSSFVEIGVALLAVTALAGWLLFRAGRRLAGDGRTLGRCVARGAAVAVPYAAGTLLVATAVTIEEPVGLGRLVQGELRASLAVAQALLFPLAIAGVAAGAGGGWAWLASRPQEDRARSAAASLAGGWRMLWIGLALSYAGLFVAGVVRPEDPVAALTPSTARYYDVVFERPAAGAAILGHHLALGPNEAAWTLVPAAGGCDVVRGTERADVLCYRRFPELGTAPTGELLPSEPAISFGSAPPGYLSFLLAPAAAAVLGGRHAARRLGASGSSGAATGAVAGVAFAVMLGVTALLAGVTLDYGATVGTQEGGGSLWIGPDVAGALLLGLAWGVLGGALGGSTAGLRSAAAPRSAGPAPR